MGWYVLRRALRLLPVLVIVTLATTFMLDLVPGDPALVLAGEDAPPEVIDAVNAQYGFNDSPLERYLSWMGSALTGDLGSSYRTKQPVVQEILERIPVTLEIALLAGVLALLIAIPTALYCASHVGSRVDRLVGVGTSAVISVPVFLLALLLVYVLAVRLHVFPVTGWTRLTDDPGRNLRSAFLPVLTLALGEAVIQTRVLRADAIQTLQDDYILMARAKGMPKWHVLLRHAFRPSSFSLLTLASLSLGRLIGGTIVVETVFALPGIGRLAVTAITGKDLITMQGIVAFVAVSYIVINVVVDLLYAALDPRIRVRS
ncbi:ABC transporter permease [Dactylosporangium sp. AC04546]|uniref:ABC transporter permease n=1 Tax=Dactylosporangium sp. AC04546 TaxID=2862460 RepID=UPI001EDE62F8|nr:ABC transporter permease [Dactylosporangium sp. AC04546]WVK86940.1 ABC transporter permease [Dactylosporangium sp. AC04546]